MPTHVVAVPPDRLISAALDRARLGYWEAPAAALEEAIRCREQAWLLRDEGLQSRALTLAGAVSLHRGDLHGAFTLVAQAEPLAGDDLAARAELASLKT